MLLKEVIEQLQYERVQGTLDRVVSGVAYDSRQVTEDGVFVAISGFTTDGHAYIHNAVQNGAKVIVLEKDAVIREDVTVLRVKDCRNALALLAANFFRHPSEMLNLIGVTGTNGKTSITYFIKSIFAQAHRSIGIIGTIGTWIGDELRKNPNTTPEAPILQQQFAEMTQADIMNCVMEVSSHALNLDRVAYSRYNTAIFTNLTPDHLELHGNMEEYFAAKAKLFEMASDTHIINADDPYGRRLIEQVELRRGSASLLTYGVENKADVYATDIEQNADNTIYTAHTSDGSFRVKVNIPGMFYVYNSLAAIACAYSNGIDIQDIRDGIEKVENIRGRMEVVYQDHAHKVIVDFAHTEDSLEKALLTIKPHTKGRLILVFGVYAAPGALGLSKRRNMGKVAAKWADLSVITSDNPKDQDPEAILKDIAQAMEEEKGTFTTIVDREEAIRYAVEQCREGDCILIAGKGHETTQLIGKREIPFNEAELVRRFFQAKK